MLTRPQAAALRARRLTSSREGTRASFAKAPAPAPRRPTISTSTIAGYASGWARSGRGASRWECTS